MPINNVAQMNNTFKTYDAKNWSKTAELGNQIDLKDPGLNLEKATNQSFGDFLANSIAKVNNIQHDANIAMQKMSSGESKNIHETLLAVEKADIAFKQMNQVRLKIIDAYKEIMKMQV